MVIDIYTPEPYKILHKTKADLAQRIPQNIVHIVQYDKKMPVVEVELYLNGDPYVIPDDISVQIRWSKKDGTFTYKPVLGCNEDRTSVYFDVDDQMSYYAGDLNPVIEITKTTSDEGLLRAGSQAIPVTIDRNPIQDTDVESQIDFQYMEEILNEMEAIGETSGEYLDETKAFRDQAEEFKNAAASSATNAATSATNAANSATAANTAKDSAYTYSGNASTKASQAATSATNAANSATAANASKEQAATSATNAANSAIDAASSAEEVITAINRLPNPFYPAGDWNAETNTPEVMIPDITKVGAVYRVSVAGTRFSFDWKVGDKLVYYTDGSIGKWDVTDEVTVADLDAKLDKITSTATYGRAYGIQSDGSLFTPNITQNPVGTTLMFRTNTGQGKFVEAVNADEAIVKSQFDTALNTKQDKLTAGDNITIEDNIISVNENVGESKRVGQLQEFGASLDKVQMNDWKLLECNGDFKPHSQYPELSSFLKSFVYAEQISTSPISADMYGYPIMINTNIYYVHSDFYGEGSTKIIKYNTITKIVSEIDVPKALYNTGIVVGTKIYYVNKSEWGLADQDIPIIEFDSISETCNTIVVQADRWSNPIVIGTDIYYINAEEYPPPSRILKLDTVTKTGSYLPINANESGELRGAFVVNNDIYYSVYNDLDGCSYIKTNTLTGEITHITNLYNPQNGRYDPIVVGTNVYFTRVSIGYGETNYFIKFNSLTQEETAIPVLEGQWNIPVLINDNIWVVSWVGNNNFIGKFNLLTNTMEKQISVKNEITPYSYNQHFVIGTDILYAKSPNVLMRFDTLNELQSDASLPLGTRMYNMVSDKDSKLYSGGIVNDTITELTLYLRRSIEILPVSISHAYEHIKINESTLLYSIQNNGSKLLRFDTKTNEGLVLDVPAPNGTNRYWRYPVLVGTNVYFTDDNGSNSSLLKVNILTNEATKLNTLTNATVWGRSVVVGTNIYYYNGGYANVSRIGKFDTLTGIGSNITVPSNSYQFPVLLGTDIYFGSNNQSTQIKKLNTLNDTVSIITVPSLKWADAKVVGTDIYYFYGFSEESSIGKLDTLTNIGTIITVPLGYWQGPGVLVGSKIYSQYTRNKLLPVFDTETQTGTILTLSELTQTTLKRDPILVGTELYYGSNSTTDTILVLDIHSHDVLELPVPRSIYTNPILVGTDIYYAGDLATTPFSVRRLGFSFKLPEMVNKYVQY